MGKGVFEREQPQRLVLARLDSGEEHGALVHDLRPRGSMAQVVRKALDAYIESRAQEVRRGQ